MKIDKHTKIAALIKHNKLAIEAIASINPHFTKLRNPVLRAVLAPRVSIEDAARIGKCSVHNFFDKLKELGFEPLYDETTHTTMTNENETQAMPEFLSAAIRSEKITPLDVRPVLAGGTDPFNQIMQALKDMPVGNVLKLVNTFKPLPLINVLKGKGYLSYTETLAETVITYFWKGDAEPTAQTGSSGKINMLNESDFANAKQAFAGKIQEIDVRNLEMPLPMVTILEACEKLPKEQALFVFHKKVPQYLLPELEERGFTVCIHDIEEGNVHLLIHA